jgi:Xaa-Pro aminopeptidase
MTRTVFLGKPDEKFKKMYLATKESQEVAMDYLATHMKKGFEIKKAQELANSHLKTQGFPKIPHAIGHGVGLQVHELPYVSPYADEDLVPGMVITNEPGVYIPNQYGVRIEDTVLITQNGLDVLTKSPKELIVV